MPDKPTIEDLETDLSNGVYKAALVYERAENFGYIHGNGHHMAQALAAEAVLRFRERVARSAPTQKRSLRLLRIVRGDFPVGHATVAQPRIYEPADILVNPHGAVSVKATNGAWLGIKPEEMEWID